MTTLSPSPKPAFRPSQTIVEVAQRLTFFQYWLLGLVPACVIAFFLVSNPSWTLLFSMVYYLAVGLMLYVRISDWARKFQLDSSGLRISRLWGNQYIPFSEIDEVRPKVRSDGKMQLSVVFRPDPNRCVNLDLLSGNKKLASEIQEQFDCYCQLAQSAVSVPAELLRNNRPLPLWLMDLDSLALQATDLSPYRRQTVEAEKLLQLVQNSAVAQEVRAAAGYVLAKSSAAGTFCDSAIQHSSPFVVCLAYLACPGSGPVTTRRFEENLRYLSRRDKRSMRAFLASKDTKVRVASHEPQLRVAQAQDAVEVLVEQEGAEGRKREG